MNVEIYLLHKTIWRSILFRDTTLFDECQSCSWDTLYDSYFDLHYKSRNDVTEQPFQLPASSQVRTSTNKSISSFFVQEQSVIPGAFVLTWSGTSMALWRLLLSSHWSLSSIFNTTSSRRDIWKMRPPKCRWLYYRHSCAIVGLTKMPIEKLAARKLWSSCDEVLARK
jgi:hypothetical protein